MLVPVILSGGAGTRLWPLSRELYPKQFLPLVGERTMIQETALRTAGLPDVAAPIVVCNEAHRFLVAEQMRELGITPQAILLEPIGRNTAPAVAVAALAALAGHARNPGKGGAPVLLVLPADHVLKDVESLGRAVTTALPAAREGRLVTFGVVPTQAETGYGYIRQGGGDGPVRPVAEFVEKPDAARAKAFVASGDYFWNSGMFLLPAQGYLDELGRQDPKMLEACRKGLRGGRGRPGFRAPRQGRLRGLPRRFHRLRRDGKDEPRGRGAAVCGLERRRVIRGAAGRAAAGSGRQRHAR